MTTFAWLLVAHLVGDWMLQNDWMARHKQDRLFNAAIALHCIMYTLVTLGSLWLLTLKNLTQPAYFLFTLLIFLSHWVIDATALARHWARFFKQSDQRFVHIMVDQTMHVVVLACLTQFLLQ
jgi:biotin transporter BioY